MHKILILDGADKVGKSASINKLIQLYEDKGYKVLPMFSKEFTKFGQEIDYEEDEKFDDCFKTIKNMYDVVSGHLQTISFFVKHIFDLHQNEKFIIIFDRLHLSSLVFGTTLRPSKFEAIWGRSKNYVKYMNIFERRMQRYAEVQLLVLINDSTEFQPDDANFVKMGAVHLEVTNNRFEKVFQLSEINNKVLIYCQKDDDGWFNTYEQILLLVRT